MTFVKRSSCDSGGRRMCRRIYGYAAAGGNGPSGSTSSAGRRPGERRHACRRLKFQRGDHPAERLDARVPEAREAYWRLAAARFGRARSTQDIKFDPSRGRRDSGSAACHRTRPAGSPRRSELLGDREYSLRRYDRAAVRYRPISTRRSLPTGFYKLAWRTTALASLGRPSSRSRRHRYRRQVRGGVLPALTLLPGHAETRQSPASWKRRLRLALRRTAARGAGPISMDASARWDQRIAQLEALLGLDSRFLRDRSLSVSRTPALASSIVRSQRSGMPPSAIPNTHILSSRSDECGSRKRRLGPTG